MKRTLTTFALCCTMLAASAQTMLNIAERKTTSLDGEWKTIIDPYGHGNWSYWQDQKFDGSRLQDYNFDSSPSLRVPGDWNTQRPELYYYEGNMWYRTKFNYKPSSPNNKQFLHFGAANYKAKVWVNSKEVGEHEGGYTPFEFDVTGKLKEGTNSLVVRVNAERLADGIPTFNTDWWNYGGLTRSVNLVEVPATYIYDYNVNISDDYKTIKGWLYLRGENITNQKVSVSIPELKLCQTCTTDERGRIGIDMKLPKKSKLQLWSPENPKLYKVTFVIENQGSTDSSLSTLHSSLSDQIGFRTIKTEGDKILLNGNPVFLAGINIHEETFGDSRQQ